jgi:hypothetical protein
MGQDNPQNPLAISLPPGTQPQFHSVGRGGEVFGQEIHGKWYYGSYYNRVYNFLRSAVTVPTIAGSTNLVSVFSLYNPPTSTVNLELIDFDMGVTTTTLVVNTLGLYWQGPTLAAQATLTTIGVFGTNWFSGLLGGNAGQGNPYSALTHVNTNVTNFRRVDILTSFGAVSSTNDLPCHKEFDGRVLIQPGCVITVATSTAATNADVDLGLRWLEVNVT